MIKKLLFISILGCISMACDENIVSPIPNAPVSLTLDLMGMDNSLNASLSYKEYITPRLGTDRLGFGGILVINGIAFDSNPINLYAYDLACPNEVQRNIRIKPENTGLRAICPQCGAVYKIATGGAPESGSKFWLKRYNVVQDRWNNTRYNVTP